MIRTSRASLATKILLSLVLLSIAALVPGTAAFGAEATIVYKHESFPEYQQQLATGQIQAVTINKRVRSIHITLKDGSRFIALLDGDTLGFDTVLFGKKEFATGAIRRVAVTQPKAADDADDIVPERSRLAITGGQTLGGQIDLAELHFLSPSGVIPVAPNLIRTLHNTSEDGSEESPIFTAELWGGGAVSGALREPLLPVRSGGALLRVPTREVTDAFVPSPIVPEGLRDKIAKLVRDLGDPGWEKREAASRELGELGAMARAQLEEALKQTTDAEVKRRAQALLDAIQG